MFFENTDEVFVILALNDDAMDIAHDVKVCVTLVIVEVVTCWNVNELKERLNEHLIQYLENKPFCLNVNFVCLLHIW